MPLACDPTQTFDTWLKSDADKPADERPTFVFRYPSGRQSAKADRVFADIQEIKDDPDRAVTMLGDAVRQCLAGWRNLPEPYEPSRLEDLLTTRELAELVHLLLRGGSPSVADLGKSDAQP